MKSGFLEKLIHRIGRVSPEDLEEYVVRLAKEKGFFETVFNTIQEGIIVTDIGGKILYINNAACSMFGIRTDDAVGKRLSERVRGIDWDSLAKAEHITSRDMEVFYPENRYLNFYVAPMTVEAPVPPPPKKRHPENNEPEMEIHELIGFAMIVRDITESRRSAQETIESERLNALTLLAAGVAHEIGNPLNSLHIHLQLLERRLRKLDPEERAPLAESVEIARGEVQRLDFIITEFLKAIRPSEPQMERGNVNDVINEAVSFLEAEITDRDIQIEKELRTDLPVVQMDRNQLKQAFYNVIRNSFQAMKTGGILRVTTDYDDTFVQVIFADSGEGISPENMSKLFQPFFTTKSHGTGLGLLIVRRIVREHGGEIDIETGEGKGLRLTIRLPHRNKQVRMLEAGNLAEVRSEA